MMYALSDQVVLITGSEGFLGKYFVESLKSAGGLVIATDIAEGAPIRMDVTQQDSIDAVFEDVVSEHGGVDIVINNAAIDPKFDTREDDNRHEFIHYPEDAMRQSLEVNLLGTWRVCKAALRHMVERRSGTIVNVTSFYGVTPPRQEIYSSGKEKPVDYPMTKAAIGMLTAHVASQFGRAGIRANALAPGGVVRDHDRHFQAEYAKHTSLGRMNTPEEITDALLFLASDASRGMTGETLVVDAGWRSR